MKERRRYYRINDSVSLKYRVVQNSDMENELNQMQYGQLLLTDLHNTSKCLDARLDAMCRHLGKSNPLIAEMLELINKKFAIIDRMIYNKEEQEDPMSPAQEVIISAGGIAFDAQTPLAKDTRLKMELVIFPECHYIPAYARVIHCRKKEDDSIHRYKIAVDFIGLSEEDREKIVNHVLKKESEKLRRERGSNAATNVGTGKKASVG